MSVWSVQPFQVPQVLDLMYPVDLLRLDQTSLYSLNLIRI